MGKLREDRQMSAQKLNKKKMNQMQKHMREFARKIQYKVIYFENQSVLKSHGQNQTYHP